MSAVPDTTIPPPVAEAALEEDQCVAALDGEYDMRWHVASIFIIMCLSFLGTLLPMVGRKVSGSKLGDLPFQCLKLLGSGVILSTAFIHMYTPAQSQLTNECLPEVFHNYEAWAGAIAIFGILFTHFVQVVAVQAIRQKHTATGPVSVDKSQEHTHQNQNQNQHDHQHDHQNDHQHDHQHDHERDHHHQHGPDSSASSITAESATTSQNPIPTPAVTSPAASNVAIIDLEQGGLLLPEPHLVHRHSHAHADDAHVHSLVLADAEKTMTTYILELGIASHSIIIGLTLGAAREEFKTLFIALCFHQFFEGLALSTVVLDADIKKRAVAIGMVVFYSFTTPIGIALGIALNETWNENATAALVSTGVLDALSAGILLYDGLANIIVPHFQSLNFRRSSIKAQGLQLFSLWLGAFVMAVIGRWA
ncbi:Zinc/iron permease [Powellomyces hirtus]|nr:Zinc/iron permease [Powellomyces hirtus]